MLTPASTSWPDPSRRRVAVIGTLLIFAACTDSSAPKKKTVAVTPVDPATAGKIQVEVRYHGTPPAPAPINMRSAPACASAHTEPVLDESLIVKDGRLANAVVWVEKGLEGRGFAVPSEPVLIDQKGCMFAPHVAAAMVDQAVEFRNGDAESHNIHGRPQVLSSWNFIISRQGASRTLSFDKPEIAAPIGCDIHPWMRAYLAVVDNPYFAVTSGTEPVTLSPLPPGDYTVSVWHEKLGKRQQRVALAATTTSKVEFLLAPEP